MDLTLKYNINVIIDIIMVWVISPTQSSYLKSSFRSRDIQNNLIFPFCLLKETGLERRKKVTFFEAF